MRIPIIASFHLMIACTGAPTTTAQSDTARHEVIAPAEFADRLASAPGPLIDVRTPEEWSEGVIKGARLIDFHGPTFREAVLTTPHDRPVYLYCAAGGRSYKAAQFMLQNGYAHIVELDGGMDAWQEAGQMVVPPGNDSKR